MKIKVKQEEQESGTLAIRERAMIAKSSAAVARPRAGKLNGSVGDHNPSEEMQIYFSKLKDLVPYMPKNKKLSKLEIIQYVISYICELQLVLESGKVKGGKGNACSMVAADAASTTAADHSISRRPLGVIPDTNSPIVAQKTCRWPPPL